MNASRSVRSRSSATRRTSWPWREQVVDAGERACDVFGRDRVEHRVPQFERRAAERGLHRAAVERTAADGERLVEHRQRVARRTGGLAGDEIEHLGIGFDAFAAEDVGEVADELLAR